MTSSSSAPHGDSTSVWVIDQIENGTASVEVNGKTFVTMPVEVLPRGVREGDVLRATIVHDPAEQARRLGASAAQVEKGGKGGKGDITL